MAHQSSSNAGVNSMNNAQDRMKRSTILALALASAALFPTVSRHMARRDALRAVDDLAPGTAGADPALTLRIEHLGSLLSSWQTVGGCGAGASATGGGGVKWIGRGVTGGLFGVQLQSSYTRVPTTPSPEHHYFLNTLISKDLNEVWAVATNIPFIYKDLPNFFGLGTDISNSGIGDMSLMLTRRLGPILATSVTGSLVLPTGINNAKYQTIDLKPGQQTGFGKVTGSLMVDHTLDQTWGLVVVGANAAYRGGINDVDNHRASTGSLYAYTGYFLGPLVPAVGVSVSGYAGHDWDKSTVLRTPLFSITPSFSLEWSTAWVAVLLGASMPYQNDGISRDNGGFPRSPWSVGAWTVALGIALSPF